MNHHPLLAVAATICLGHCLLTTNIAAQDEPIYSGPQAGEKLPELAITTLGTDAPEKESTNKEIEFKATTADANARLIVFVHQVTRPSVAFVRTLGNYAASRKKDGLETAVVFLTDDSTETFSWMQRASNALPKAVTLGVSPDGLEGPGAFGLNRNVTLTILVAKADEVTFNQTLIDPNLPTELPKTLQAICDLVGGEVPDVKTLQENGMAMQRGRDQAAKPNQDPPAPPGFERVEPLLRRLIRKETSDEAVDQLATQIDEIAKEKPAVAERLKLIAGRVYKIYGTPKAQTHLRRWAGVEDEKTEP